MSINPMAHQIVLNHNRRQADTCRVTITGADPHTIACHFNDDDEVKFRTSMPEGENHDTWVKITAVVDGRIENGYLNINYGSFLGRIRSMHSNFDKEIREADQLGPKYATLVFKNYLAMSAFKSIGEKSTDSKVFPYLDIRNEEDAKKAVSDDPMDYFNPSLDRKDRFRFKESVIKEALDKLKTEEPEKIKDFFESFIKFIKEESPRGGLKKDLSIISKASLGEIKTYIESEIETIPDSGIADQFKKLSDFLFSKADELY